ncbi:Pimeloyl-ACP methyl ester carboxylesterase [Marinobacter daqiaonensis]|uniref:Pimeloyl-ACP methyl ester carboxylesterase n=1 Tax=Marinobacter daqiaonensis TaxID=650891 RepID=A0A1I6GWY2_9GAMM|nr:alpha/beta hydrolase [Marinobacter daqiaonensis]SFR46567.1 Pimeloyl-ACP methyl ester carboxylesterase [Marinobacter daqiaonensis]
MNQSFLPTGLSGPDADCRDIQWPLKSLTLAGLHWPCSRPEGKTTPVLMLHGWLDNCLSFYRLAPRLRDTGDLWAIDHAGHGLSGHRPPGHSYLLADYVSDLAELLETHFPEHESVDLVGHSLGGIVALMFAGAFPEKVRRLVMIDSLGPLSKAPEEAVGQLRRGIHKRLTGSGQSAGYASVDEAARLRGRGRNPLSPEVAKVMLSRNLEQGSGGLRWRTDPRLRHPSVMMFTEEQVMAFVESVTARTLLIRAEHGLLANFDRWQDRYNALPDVRSLDIDGGHHCHLDGDISPVASGIRSFLAEA